MKRAAGAHEVLDGELSPTDLAATLGDIDRLNAWFGGHALTRHQIDRLTAGVPHDRAVSVADVGGGTAAFAVRLAAWARRHGRPVALVGWSLGGLFAREIAHRIPDRVSRVITMGTPFSGDPRANNAWRAYQLITGHAVDAPPIDCVFAAKPPVPTIALWSPRDGIIAPRSACGWPDERDRAVALRCNHLGFAASPEAIAEVLRQLDAQF